PLVTHVYELGAEEYTLPRNTYEECVDQIVSDCDSAVLLLEGIERVDGRANEVAALALKARVLTYAASDLHDASAAKGKSSLISGYSNPELLGYTSGDRMARWQLAKEAAKKVIDFGEYAYQLDLASPATAE